jgi:hypothetical protein
MYSNSSKIFAFMLMVDVTFLSGCGSGSNDEVMGNIIMDCQFSAHNAIDAAPFNDEKKHFVIGENVERCLKEKGLQPIHDASVDSACFEASTSTENGKGFIKPLQKCWKNSKYSKD